MVVLLLPYPVEVPDRPEVLVKTRIIKQGIRPWEGDLHPYDPVPPDPTNPLDAKYPDQRSCKAIRTDGQVCGLDKDDHQAERSHNKHHWCQPSGHWYEADHQPCLYCGFPLVRIGDEWYYALPVPFKASR